MWLLLLSVLPRLVVLYLKWTHRICSRAQQMEVHRRVRSKASVRFEVALQSAVRGTSFCTSWPFGASWTVHRMKVLVVAVAEREVGISSVVV